MKSPSTRRFCFCTARFLPNASIAFDITRGRFNELFYVGFGIISVTE